MLEIEFKCNYSKLSLTSGYLWYICFATHWWSINFSLWWSHLTFEKTRKEFLHVYWVSFKAFAMDCYHKSPANLCEITVSFPGFNKDLNIFGLKDLIYLKLHNSCYKIPPVKWFLFLTSIFKAYNMLWWSFSIDSNIYNASQKKKSFASLHLQVYQGGPTFLESLCWWLSLSFPISSFWLYNQWDPWIRVLQGLAFYVTQVKIMLFWTILPIYPQICVEFGKWYSECRFSGHK